MASLGEMNPRAQLLLLAALAAGLVFAGEYSLLSPQVTANQALETQVRQLEATNLRLRPLASQLPRLNAENRQLEAQWHQAQSMLPLRRSTDDFLHQLQQTASTHGVHLRRIQAQPAVRRQYYIESPYKVVLDGSYTGILQFYQQLAGMPRIVRVSGLSLKSLQSGGGSAYSYSPGETVESDCVITTYFSPASDAAPAPAGGKHR